MTASEAIRARRSIRSYAPGVTIPQEHIHQMLEAAMMAPSACNFRPWEFFVVENRDALSRIAAASPYAGFVDKASLAVVVCGIPETQGHLPGDGYWPQDCGAAIQNLLLQAVELGYGTCWCGLYPVMDRTNTLREILGTDRMPLGVIAVGVPTETPAPRGHYEESKVHYIK